MGPSTAPSVRIVAVALAVTLGAQTLAAFGVHSPAVFGPIATRDLGLSADKVGAFVTISYGAAMLVGLASPAVIGRHGPLRTVQLSVVFLAIGLLFGAFGAIWSVIVAAILTGVGNGLVGPVSAQILAERSPRHLTSLIFSIKQTGVPLGGALAGVILPAAVLTIGWQRSLVIAAVVYLVVAVAMQPLRAQYDSGRNRNARLDWRATVAQMRRSIAYSWNDPRQRDLAIAGYAYVATQLTVMTYAVSYFNLELGYSLVLAGFIYSAMQIAGIVGRIVWGALGDRVRRPQRLLGLLGLASAIIAAVLALSSAQWPIWLVMTVGIAFGLTGVAWNGVYFSEVARGVPREQVGQAAGGALFFSFLGGITGPALFTLFAPGPSSYALGFGLIGLTAAFAGVRLIVRARYLPVGRDAS